MFNAHKLLTRSAALRIAGLFVQPISLDPRLDPDPEEPLGIEYVLASAKSAGHHVRLFTPLDAPEPYLAPLVSRFRPDVLAISLYTHHVPAALMVAKEVRDSCPGTVVVVGGPHPTAVPEIVSRPEVDIAVIGEGEQTFCNLLEVLSTGRDLRSVDGIAYRTESGTCITRRRKRIQDPDRLAYPLYQRSYYRFPGSSLSFPPMSRVVYAPMLFSRGCSMTCRFCSSRALWGGEVRTRDPGCVVREMRHLRDCYGVNFIYFEDLTFALARGNFDRLCSLIRDENLGLHWGCETHVATVTPDQVAAMASAGCTKVLWGIESVSDSTLQRNKKQQTRAEVVRRLREAANCGILNWGCCIVGFPWESEGDILRTADDLPSLDIHQLRVSIATPFPGSEWHKELPPAALHPDLSLYDTNHLVYDHPTISPERMKELQNEVFRRFYRSSRYHDRVSRMVRQFPHLRESFDEWLAYIDENLDRLDAGETELTQILAPTGSPREEVPA